MANDPVRAVREFAHWTIRVMSTQTSSSSGHGFIGIGRNDLLEIPTAGARSPVELHLE